MNQGIRLTVNGQACEGVVEPRTSLADFLRDELNLTGTHVGCEHGVCGACTVLMDGDAVRSCLLLAIQADGHAIMTVEGLAGGSAELHPLPGRSKTPGVSGAEPLSMSARSAREGVWGASSPPN